MLQGDKVVRKVAREISEAANGALDAYVAGRIEEEPHITDRMLGAVDERIKNRKFNGIIWQARTLRTSRGRAAEEKRHGADLMGILDVDLPKYRIKKGFLAQAKRAEPGVPLKNWEHLIHQCKKMVERTEESFVFIYSRNEGIRIFPAVAVISLKSKDIFDLYSLSVQTFFEKHLECFIGDLRLDSTDIRTLDALAEFSVERILYIEARMSG